MERVVEIASRLSYKHRHDSVSSSLDTSHREETRPGVRDRRRHRQTRRESLLAWSARDVQKTEASRNETCEVSSSLPGLLAGSPHLMPYRTFSRSRRGKRTWRENPRPRGQKQAA